MQIANRTSKHMMMKDLDRTGTEDEDLAVYHANLRNPPLKLFHVSAFI